MPMGIVPLFFDLDHTLWDFVSNSRKTLREGYEAFALYDLGVTCLLYTSDAADE